MTDDTRKANVPDPSNRNQPSPLRAVGGHESGGVPPYPSCRSAPADRKSAVADPAAALTLTRELRRSPWLDVSTAAAYLGISGPRVYALIDMERIPVAGYADGAIRLLAADLDEYVRTCEQRPRWKRQREARDAARRFVEGVAGDPPRRTESVVEQA